MKTRIQIALMGCLVSVATHVYLTMHYYALKFGFAAGNSVCNLNGKFNCDAVAASNYSSVFGMPLSVLGAATNLILFIMILISWLEWSDHPERLKRWTLLLSGTSLAASVVMAGVSVTAMENYCLFCMLLYVLSAVIFFSYRGVLKEPLLSNLSLDVPELFGASRGILTCFLAIPVIAYVGHKSYMANIGNPEVESMVREVIGEWQVAPKQNFVAQASLTMGPAADKAALTLTEFADFRCGHCRHANYTLDAFVRSHPDVRLEFYSFPLDGACNEKIGAASGISCRLAELVQCAEKEGKGWEMHHLLYDIQDEVNRLDTVQALDPVLAQSAAQLGLNWERLQTCMVDPAIQDAIRAQAKQGALVEVKGTPTIFANGRLLNAGQMVPVLQAARASAQSSKGM